VPKEYIRTLQLNYEVFARRLATLLTSTLRVVSHVELVSIEQCSYEEYTAGLESPTLLALLALDPLPGTSILELPLQAGMSIIDHMLGGPGGEQPQRVPTDIEVLLLRGVLGQALAELRVALQPLVDVLPQLGALEYNPQFVQAIAPKDPVLAAFFEVGIGSGDCAMSLCVPLSSILRQLRQATDEVIISAGERATREAARARIVSGLAEVPVAVGVRFEPVGLLPEQLLRLRPGDIVPLRHPVSTPLRIVSAGSTFGYAVPTKHGDRQACLVVSPPDKEDR
jgi:flagellar motor switch protein FliM